MKGAGDHTSSGGVWPLRWVLERPRLCIALVLLLVCGLALGLGRLRFESSYEVYFDRDNPRLRALDALYARFSRNDNVLFALAPRAGADTMRLQAFSPKVLAAVQDLTRSAWQLPYASRVDSVANHLHIDSDADGVRIEPLLDDETVPDEASSRRVASIALNQHALLNRLVAADGNTLGVNVRLQLPNGDRRAVTEATDAARVLAERIRARHAGVEVWVTGNAVLNAAFMQTGQRDLLTLTPAMYLVMALVLCWLLGSVRAALIALGITTASILVGLGFAGWAGLAMTSASIAAPTIIATVALVGTIHVLTTVHRELQSDATPTAVPGARAAPALARALTLNALPVTITSLTTGLGFLSLNLSDAPPFRD
ncbi:MAG: MMPL family transporter, partial [Gammaproteobacteria bacterium]|nr:MMPL family transporter [Gammaproteobacteria bacterium]